MNESVVSARELAWKYSLSVKDVLSILDRLELGSMCHSTEQVFVKDLDMELFESNIIPYRWREKIFSIIEDNPGITVYKIHQELLKVGAGNIGITGVNTALHMLTNEYLDLYEDAVGRLYVRGCDL